MKLYGTSLPSEIFKIEEDYKKPDLEKITKMLLSENNHNPFPPIYIVRNFISIEACSIIEENFSNQIRETSGGNRIENFVKVEQIGSSQFQKTSTQYIKECNQSAENVGSLLNGLENKDIRDFLLENTMQNFFLKHGIHFGPSYFGGSYCNLFTARLWKNESGLALLPHEDFSQLQLAKDDDFEIGSIKTVIAENLCVQNAKTATLKIWNIAPSDQSKRELGLEKLGYPYPLELVENFNCISLKTNPGDLYFINANFIHAVTNTEGGTRISMGRFLGYPSSKKIVYWT